MRDFPVDLIVFLVFGAFLLAQILRRRRKPVSTKPVETVPQTTFEFEPAASAWMPGAPDADLPLLARPARGGAPATARDVRRFSRRALMGDRRAVQDAFVIAAILRPCHAHRPYDAD